MIVKASLHTHIKGDPVDNIKHNWKELIDHAKTKGFNALAITCHKKIIFPQEANLYAQKNGILLIKGAEIHIGKQHVLILNADKSAEEISSFEDLNAYKENHPESLIIAPHPYFPTNECLKSNLGKYIDLFDAVEFSYFFTKIKNYNKKAVETANRFGKPLIGTSDCHILKYLGLTYSLIDIGENTLTEKSLFSYIKEHKIEIVAKPLSAFKALSILLEMYLDYIIGTYEKLFKDRKGKSSQESKENRLFGGIREQNPRSYAGNHLGRNRLPDSYRQSESNQIFSGQAQIKN